MNMSGYIGDIFGKAKSLLGKGAEDRARVEGLFLHTEKMSREFVEAFYAPGTNANLIRPFLRALAAQSAQPVRDDADFLARVTTLALSQEISAGIRADLPSEVRSEQHEDLCFDAQRLIQESVERWPELANSDMSAALTQDFLHNHNSQSEGSIRAIVENRRNLSPAILDLADKALDIKKPNIRCRALAIFRMVAQTWPTQITPIQVMRVESLISSDPFVRVQDAAGETFDAIRNKRPRLTRGTPAEISEAQAWKNKCVRAVTPS